MSSPTPSASAPKPQAPAGDAASKAYQPSAIEPVITKKWAESGAFHPDPQRVLRGEAKPSSIVIPPPNVTGALHLGHALNNTLQDILTRAHRMMGFETLWMPGTDHAGIATQAVVEKRLLKEEGKRRKDFTREQFVARVQEWKDEYEARITGQLVAMGCSCDFQRQRFTMDDICARAVREAFFVLFRDGLIYRGKRLVNWDPVLQTAVADDECYEEELDSHFYYLRYPLVHRAKGSTAQAVQPVTWNELARRGYPGAEQNPGEQQAWVTVATTRPETYLGDTAVAVNPKDPRAAALRGLLVELPLVGRVIPILEDDYVVLPAVYWEDQEAAKGDAKAQFATGFLKVTPAHDQNDYELGMRHKAEIEACGVSVLINVMAPDASISDKHGWSDEAEVRGAHMFIGLPREKARKKVIEEFKARNVGESAGAGGEPLFEGSKPYRHSVKHSDRSKAIVEPYLSDQWFVKVTDDRLSGAANRAVAAGQRSEQSLSRQRERGAVGVWTVTPRATFGASHPEEGNEAYEDFGSAVASACAELCGVDRRSVFTKWDAIKQTTRVFTLDVAAEKTMAGFAAWLAGGAAEGSLDKAIPLGAARKLAPLVSALAAGGADASPESALAHARGSDGQGDGAMTFHPARYAKTYEQWHDNIRDWCISRQLWWGHRIPVWHRKMVVSEGVRDYAPALSLGNLGYAIDLQRQSRASSGFAIRSSTGEMLTQSELSDLFQARLSGEYDVFLCLLDPAQIEYFELRGFSQDPDVLDTWFSSALWPLSTMGWPEPAQSPQTAGLLEAFNPTSVLSTAREIITLWVSRMVMMNRYLLGAGGGHGPVPFRDVFIHAVVQDGEGRKMSKSLGNGVDPLDIIESHGADAMRFTLCQMTTQTQDVRMPVVKDSRTGKNTSPKFDLGRNFCNKLWNASRFAIGMLPKQGSGGAAIDAASLSLVDRWMLSRLASTTRQIDGLLKNYEFSDYADAVYRLLWWDVCDWYLEAIKPTIAGSQAQQAVLAHALEVVVRLLHPITPFVTEAVWEQLRSVQTASIAGIELGGSRTGLLCTAGWPRVSGKFIDSDAEKTFESLRELVSAIRNARSEHQVPPKRKITLHASNAALKLMALSPGLVETLAGVEKVEATAPGTGVAAVVVRAMGEEMHLSNLADAIDAGAEKERLAKQLEQLVKSEAALAGRLNNPGYVERAPAKLVEESKAQLAKIQGEIAAIKERLGSL